MSNFSFIDKLYIPRVNRLQIDPSLASFGNEFKVRVQMKDRHYNDILGLRKEWVKCPFKYTKLTGKYCELKELDIETLPLPLSESVQEVIKAVINNELTVDNLRDFFLKHYCSEQELNVLNWYQMFDKIKGFYKEHIETGEIAETLDDIINFCNKYHTLASQQQQPTPGKAAGEEILYPEPLPEKACLIYEKLVSLEKHEAMTQNQILDWLSKEHNILIDNSTLKGHFKTIKTAGYNLQHKAKTGYYIR